MHTEFVKRTTRYCHLGMSGSDIGCGLAYNARERRRPVVPKSLSVGTEIQEIVAWIQ